MAIRLSDQIVRRLSVGAPNDVNNVPNSTYLFYVGGTSYFKGAITHDGNITPGANNTVYLGASDKAYKWVYANGLSANRDGSSSAGGLALYANEPTSYGIAMRAGAKHGYIWNDGSKNGTDWNINFYNNSNGGNTNRGWKFVMDGTAVASLNGVGAMYLNKALWVENTQIHPLGGEYRTTANGHTGYILITLPPRAALATMISLDVVIDQYTSGESATYHIYGYCYNSGGLSWAGAFTAFSDGTAGSTRANLPVRAWANNDAKCYYLAIGNADTTWNYVQVTVENVHLGFSNRDSDEWKRPWTISFSTTAFPSSVNYTVTDPQAKRFKTGTVAGNASYPVYFSTVGNTTHTIDTAGYNSNFVYNPTTGTITLTHPNNQSGQYRVVHGSTIDMWFGVGSGNENHGIYDAKKGDWALFGNASNQWQLNGNAATATKLASTPNNKTTFLRGDNTWANTLEGSITTTKAGEVGLEVNNTQATNPNSCAFIVGSSGNAGIYSRKYNKWLVYTDPNGVNTFNGGVAYFGGTTYYINNNAHLNLQSGVFNLDTNSTSATTGALQVKGGLGLTKNLFIGKAIKNNANQALYAGSAQRSQWYKITLPEAGTTAETAPGTSARWYMHSMTIVIGGDYNNNPRGQIELVYYIYWSGSAWTLDKCYATAIGPQIGKVKMYYSLAKPFEFYINAINAYTTIWVTHLHGLDTASSYEITNTKVETSAAITVADYTEIPMVALGSLMSSNTQWTSWNSITPSADGTLNLGTSSLRWNNTFSKKVIINNTNTSYELYVGGTSYQSGIATFAAQVKFANNTWNTVGDDAQMGDINKAGHIGIQGLNGNTGLFFTQYNQTTKTTGGAITYDGTRFIVDKNWRLGTSTLEGTGGTKNVFTDAISFTTVTPGDSSGGEAFNKGVLKYICTTYPYGEISVWGTLTPNAKGPMFGQIYSTGTVNADTGLPQYSTFFFANLGTKTPYLFGTYAYEYYKYDFITSGNYTTSINLSNMANGILPTGAGGTGNNSHTANRIVWASSVSKLEASGTHYFNGTKLALNSTSEPTENFYVNGTSRYSGAAYFDGHIHWKANTNLYADGVTANGQEWSIDLTSGDYTGCYWHVWSGKNSATIIAAYNDDRHVSIPATTETTSTTTGVLQVAGGIGVAKSIWAGNFIKSAGFTADGTLQNGAPYPGITIYPSNSNEINFGGYYTGNRNLYFGYRKVNDRNFPTAYYFGPYGQAIIYVGEVAAGTTKETYIQLGNSTPTATANNGRGRVRLYGTNAYYNDIIPTDNGANTTYYLPYSNTTIGSTSYLVGAWSKTTSSSAPFSLNNVFDSGFYNFPGGSLTDTPRGYGYGSMLVVAYRKPYGNTIPDWGWQMFHDASNNNRLWFRTSSTASAWADWQEIAHAKANTAVGDATHPVYMTAAGVITGTTYLLNATTMGGTQNYVAYYSGANQISSANTTTSMIMPSHYYHTMYSNATTGTDVYVHYYNGAVTATNTNANFRVKKGDSFNVFRLAGGGAASWDGGNIYASAGYLVQKSNSNTLTIGSQNSSWVHFSSDQNRPFYFNRTTHIDGSMNPYTNKTGGSLGTTSYLWNGAYLYKHLYIIGNEATDDSTYLMFYASDNTERARIDHNGNTTNTKDSTTYLQIKTSYGDIRLTPASYSVRVAGTLDIHPNTGTYTEGIRIYPYGSWATIMLLGTDHNNATSNYTANSWGIYNNNGNFYISRGASGFSGTYAFGHNGTNWLVKGHLAPQATNTYTLGVSNSLRWKALYIGTQDTYGATNRPIYWNAGVPTATNVGDSYLVWGDQNHSGSSTLIETAMNSSLRGQRFDGFKAAGITVEYSTNGGSSWTAYNLTDAAKRDLFTFGGNINILGGQTVDKTQTYPNAQLRITANVITGGVYSYIARLAIYLSTNYSQAPKVKVEVCVNSANNTLGTWSTIYNDLAVSGWSGWNSIWINKTFGSNSGQYGAFRLTFHHTSKTANTSTGLQIYKIYGFGGVGWTVQTNMAARDHIYTWDSAQNTTFPAKVTATGGFADYNDGKPTKFGYSTTGLEYNGTSWIAAWDTSVSGEYRLRTINSAKLKQFLFGTSKIGDTNKPIYYDGSTLAALTATVGSGIIPTYLASGTVTASTATAGSARQPVYLNGGTITAANLTVRHWPDAGKSNMNDVARQHASVGMTNLTANTTDNPVNGTTGASGWHLYWDASYKDDPNGSNAWVAQIANTAGTDRWFVRSRSGSTITNGTAWASGWRHLVTSTAAAVGSSTKAAYINAYGEATAVDYELKATVNSGTSTALAYYSGTNAISSEPRVRQHRSNRYPLDLTLHNDAGNTIAEFWYDAGNTTNVTAGSWRFRAYSPAATAGTATSGFYEDFYLPTVTSGRTANAGYNILTTKATVTTAQGGTGNTSYTANRLLYTESATKFASTASIYASTTAITINGTSAPANSGNFQVIGTSTLRHVYPQSAASYNLGTTNLTWNSLYFQGTLYQKMNADTSNYKAAITWQNPTVTTESYPAQIGWHNTGESINIIPYAQSASPWGRTIGLSVGKSTLLYNNRRVVTGISVGGTTTPTYIDANGYPQACTAYASATVGTANTLSCGLAANDVSTYTNIKVTTAKGGYYGFLLGNSKSNIHVMSSGQHNGMYCEAKGRWVFYYDSTNDRCAIGSASPVSGYILTVSGAMIVGGDINASSGNIYAPAGSIWAGTYAANTAQAAERDIGVRGGAGVIYFYSAAAVTGNRGIYAQNAAGTGGAIITVNQSNQISALATLVCSPNVNAEWVYIHRAGTAHVDCLNESTGVRIGMWSDASVHGLYSYSYWNGSANTTSGGWIIYRGTDSYVHSSFRLYSAVWNDYAEYRKAITTEPGRVVMEQKGGIMTITQERLAAGAKIISDTYGFAIGQNSEYNTPIAVSGRVLAYTYKPRTEYPLGAAVCAAPGGTVDIMTREEIMMYPERILGTVSEIPDYEIWHAGSKEAPEDIKVNGRIWIYVK